MIRFSTRIPSGAAHRVHLLQHKSPSSFQNTPRTFIESKHSIRYRTMSNRSNDAPVEQDDDTHTTKHTLFQRLGQSLNVAGISFFIQVALSNRSLAIPHLEVPNLQHIQWKKLRDAGFEGIIFDKDNTLTEPYKMQLHPTASKALKECLEIFNGRVVLYSNSAGLEQFDPEGTEASALESALGLPVLRHKEKKPAGGADDVEKHFKCSADRLIMVGDRYLTDVAFGNRLGMLTVRPSPFTSEGEPKAVRAARAIEEAFVHRCRQGGVLPPEHALVGDVSELKGFVVVDE